MFCLYNQFYLISGLGEPNLSYHTCRFIVYISTFAKPIGIYLTFLFSIERLFTKILSKFVILSNKYRQLFQRLYPLFIFLGIISIFSFRLYQVLKFLPKTRSSANETADNDNIPPSSITDITDNSTDRGVTFQSCFNSMNIDTYAKILSFYVIQSWLEFALTAIIGLILLIILVQQCRLLRNQQKRFSVNTKLYVSLSLCTIISEYLLFFFHLIVYDVTNNDTATERISLRFMLVAFNFRCILLPFIICITTCEPLKEFFYELFILRPYLENIEENDITNHQPEPFSSQRTNNRIQEKFRRTFTKQNNNNIEHLDDEELQADL